MKNTRFKTLIKTLILAQICLLSLPVFAQNGGNYYYSISSPSLGSASFQNMTGLEISFSSSDNSNGFFTQVPSKAKYDNLVLSRGVFFDANKFMNYISQSNVTPETLIVQLIDGSRVLKEWKLHGAYMASYEISGNTEKGEVMVQSVSFAYSYIPR